MQELKLGGDLFEDQTHSVRCSQLPSINLLVDLNDAGCRRRRRRQLSNLVLTREMVNQDRTQVENSVSSTEISPQSDSQVMHEVRATMAVGGELGINFQPNDEIALRSMIEMEAWEYSLMLEKEAEV